MASNEIAEYKTKLVEALDNSPVGAYVKHILLWEDAASTLLLFGIISVSFLFVIFEEYSFCTIISFILFAALVNVLIATYLPKLVLQKISPTLQPPPNPFRSLQFTAIPNSFFQSNSELLVQLFNFTSASLIQAVLVKDIKFTAQAIAGLLVLAFLGNTFSTATLVYFAVIFDFFWFKFGTKHFPKIYAKLEKKLPFLKTHSA